MHIFAQEPSGEVMVEMNVVPLIDVLLVLLVMLIITIPIQMHAVNLNLPAPDPPAAAEPTPVVRITVDFDGTVLWNDTPLPGREALAQRFRAAAAQPRQAEFHIRPNRLAEYRHVAMVLATAQRNGIRHIGIVGNGYYPG